MLDLMLGFPSISGAMLLTIMLNYGLVDVSDILVDPECSTGSTGLRSGFRAGHGKAVIAFRCRKSITARVRWGLALSSINTGLMAIAWLSK